MDIVTELDLPEFDYTARVINDNAYHERLAALRRQGWLARSPLAYLVLEREPGEFFLRSRATAFPGRQIAAFFGITSGPLAEHIDGNPLNLPDEPHRRLRALVGPVFGPRAADRWRPLMRHVLARLWPGRAGACEFVSEVATPYAAQFIAAVLGAPPEDAALLSEWSARVRRQSDPRALATNLERIETAIVHLTDYVTDLVDQPHAPSADLISDLLAASGRAGRGEDALSRPECADLVLHLIVNAISTVRNQLSHAIRLFALHPAQWDLLASRPGLVPRAVTEVLRFEPAVPFIPRICLTDVECGGVLFPEGTVVAVCVERANRQVAGGEDFDVTAERDEPVMTFGVGPHSCLGASLARAALEEGLAYLAPRSAGLALDGRPVHGGYEDVYGLKMLPIQWWRPAEPAVAGFRSIRYQ
jgi:cytochrome P450